MSIIPVLATAIRRGDREPRGAGWRSGVVRISGTDQVRVFGTRKVGLQRVLERLRCVRVFASSLRATLGLVGLVLRHRIGEVSHVEEFLDDRCLLVEMVRAHRPSVERRRR
jgi:hypothetical protein